MTSSSNLHRRSLLRSGLTLAAATALPAVTRAQSPAAAGLISRTIARAQEQVPALGLGTFLAFDTLPGQKRDHLAEVTKIYCEAGIRVVDTSPLYGTGETTVGDALIAQGLNERLFIANKLWVTGEFLADDSHARRSFEQSQNRLWRERMDLMQCHSLVNVDIVVPLLNAWKKEGRTRFVGVTHHENVYHDVLAAWINRGSVDFVQVNYSIFNRGAEQRVLPAAAEKGCGVLINMALEKGRLHQVVAGRPLPDFASEIGAANWAQFFLKYVMANPAVTCVLTTTASPAHAQENIGALRGPLPDAAMRARMLKHMEGLPGFDQIGQQPWYPGKRYPGIIGRSQAELRARS